MKFIDLFSGIGGFRLGFESKQNTCVFSADFDTYACETYSKNFKVNPLLDITTVDEKQIPHHDLLTAGFPCQPFSIAGFRKGFEDVRGTLFFDIYRILNEKRPKVFVLENVKGLINHDKGNTFKTMLNYLAKSINGKPNSDKFEDNLGYDVYWKILSLPKEPTYRLGIKCGKCSFDTKPGVRFSNGWVHFGENTKWVDLNNTGIERSQDIAVRQSGLYCFGQ